MMRVNGEQGSSEPCTGTGSEPARGRAPVGSDLHNALIRRDQGGEPVQLGEGLAWGEGVQLVEVLGWGCKPNHGAAAVCCACLFAQWWRVYAVSGGGASSPDRSDQCSG